MVTIELGSVRRGRLLLHVLRRLEMASELLFPFDNRRLSPRLEPFSGATRFGAQSGQERASCAGG